MTTERQFPVLRGSRKRPENGLISVPWAMLAPHDKQAQRNHCGQTLERLAERGGLSPAEIVILVTHSEWKSIHYLKDEECEETIIKLVTEWKAKEGQ